MSSRSLFFQFDRTGSGTLNSGQFRDLLRVYYPKITSDQADALFLYVDTDADGFIDYPEFRKMWKSRDRYMSNLRLVTKARSLYRRYTDNPTMTLEQFTKLVTDSAIRSTEEDFDRLDKNDDGVLNFNEFCQWLKWF